MIWEFILPKENSIVRKLRQCQDCDFSFYMLRKINRCLIRMGYKDYTLIPKKITTHMQHLYSLHVVRRGKPNMIAIGVHETYSNRQMYMTRLVYDLFVVLEFFPVYHSGNVVHAFTLSRETEIYVTILETGYTKFTLMRGGQKIVDKTVIIDHTVETLISLLSLLKNSQEE